MPDFLHVVRDDLTPAPDPETGGELRVHPDGFEPDAGVPFALEVTDPPGAVRPRHAHHGDVFYVYTRGEQLVPGEGVYRAGDVRWARAGHVYGPEVAGPDGVTLWVLTHANPLPIPADE